MPDPETLERRLRQRSALAEFALRAMGTADTVSMAEAATDAVCTGLDITHAGVFERKSYGLELLASAGWPHGAEPPPDALGKPGETRTLPFEGEGEIAHGVLARVEGQAMRLLVAAEPEPLSLDDDDVAFFADVAAVLRGAFARATTESALRESEARARDSEARAHAVLDTTVDGVITIDDRAAIQSFNPAAERIFGYRAAEVVGKNVSLLMPEPYHDQHDQFIRSYLETGRRRVIGIGREVVGRRRDGSTFPMDLAVSEVVVPGVRLFTGIVRDITARRGLEREVVKGIEDERRRLGFELHDELGQELSGIRLLTRDLARRLNAEGTEGDVVASANEIADLIRDADRKARTIARGLVLVNVDAEGLEAALRHMTERAGRLFGVQARLESYGEPTDVADTTATHVYRIAQEAITNAARHGKPTEIVVHLTWTPAGVRLQITDDGVGIPEANTDTTLIAPTRPVERRGLGIQTMIYRARLIGGTLDISPGDEGGTAVTCQVPLEYTPPTSVDGDPDTP